VRRRNPQARTWKDYQYDLNQFVSLMGDIPIEKITFREVDRFVNAQVSLGCKPTTINRRLATLLSLFTFLSAEQPELVCPVLPHRHLLREPQRLPRPVQETELAKFFAVITDTRDRAMFVLMLRCGLRIGEVAELRLADLFLDEPRPRLVARGKGSRERAVYLSPQAEKALRAYLAKRSEVPADFVFLSYQRDGLSTTAIHKRLMGYRAAAGVKLTAHQLRHSFAAQLLQAEVPVTTIQQLLGHRWLESTQTYVMANDPMVQADYFAACEKLEGWS
jgi:site-specific recombinase XerD